MSSRILKHDAPAGSRNAGAVLSIEDLQSILEKSLVGSGPFIGPNKTLSKALKVRIAEILGYETPKSFARRAGAIPAQDLDVFVQKTDNVQPWNGKLIVNRRYAVIRPDASGRIQAVRVVSGRDLLALDRTRSVTTKLQARVDPHISALQLVNARDTEAMTPFLSGDGMDLRGADPLAPPRPGAVIPIRDLARCLMDLIDCAFDDPGPHADRGRGEIFHRLVLDHLGYAKRGDTGRLPDIPGQLVETKLQTRDTIDLGQHDPSSAQRLDGQLGALGLAPRDVRYVVASGDIIDGKVHISRITLVSGAWFLTRFEPCRGRGQNEKLQIRLPRDFFDP